MLSTDKGSLGSVSSGPSLPTSRGKPPDDNSHAGSGARAVGAATAGSRTLHWAPERTMPWTRSCFAWEVKVLLLSEKLVENFRRRRLLSWRALFDCKALFEMVVAEVVARKERTEGSV